MTKIIFDASIHFGQFCINSEDTRIACKNSQASISAKPESEIVGVVTFNENSWVDHIIWELKREVQDTFYKFMDVFHSVKHVERIPLSTTDVKLAVEFSKKFRLDISNSLSCAVAISQEANKIHTCYQTLIDPKVREFLKNRYNIAISSPPITNELQYINRELEQRYQNALSIFKKAGINLIDYLHK